MSCCLLLVHVTCVLLNLRVEAICCVTAALSWDVPTCSFCAEALTFCLMSAPWWTNGEHVLRVLAFSLFQRNQGDQPNSV